MDIRWRLAELTGRSEVPAQWIVSLGHNDGKAIHLYRGVIEGVVRAVTRPREGAFGFDPYFVPAGQSRSLDELEQAGEKDRHSARRLAVESLLSGVPRSSRLLSAIPQWAGQYQHT